MNNKITFPRLAAMLADRSGRSKRFSEDFLREFFALISQTLEEGESVKIKGLGSFRLSKVEPRKSVDVTTGQPMEISGHTKVVFIPAKELAEGVNAPFEAFQAIEIADDVDAETLVGVEDIDITSEQDMELPIQSEITETDIPDTEIINKTTVEQLPETEVVEFESPEVEDSEKENPAEGNDSLQSSEPEAAEEVTEETREETEEPEETSVGATEPEPDDSYDFEEDIDKSKSRSWRKGFLVGIAATLAVIFASGAILYYLNRDQFNTVIAQNTNAQNEYKKAEQEGTHPEENIVLADSVVESDSTEAGTEKDGLVDIQASTSPSDALVYDTISTTRYLTTMAKTHYGNFNLWPYIYEENKSFLGHPDRIRPGTPVVIPKLSKYNVDPKNPEDIEKAKQMGIAIYARYGKSIK